MPDLYNAQFTRFEGAYAHGSDARRGLVPVHYIKEWQWPKRAAASGDAPEFKTVRISEHKWPLKNTFLCSREPISYPEDDGSWDNGGWPHDEHPLPPIDRSALIATGHLVPWYMTPICPNQGALWLDDDAEIRHARGPQGANDGLPDDYLEFWLAADDRFADDHFDQLEASNYRETT